MASHAPKPSQKSTEEMVKDLKIDPRAKVNSSGTVPTKERSKSNATSCISSAVDVKGRAIEGDTANESLETYQGLPCPFGGYYGYYFPGYDGSEGELNGQGFFGDGMELQDSAMLRENGSVIYFMPGIQPCYDANTTYFPLNLTNVEGQFASQQLLSQAPMFTSPEQFPNSHGYGDLMSSPYVWDPSLLFGDGLYGDAYIGVAEIPSSRPNMSSSRHVGGLHTQNMASLSSFNTLSGHDTGYRSKSSSRLGVLEKGCSPFPSIPFYNQESGRMDFPSGSVGRKDGAGEWIATEKVKGRNKFDNRVGDFTAFNEKNLGSRVSNGQDPITNGDNTAELVAVDGNGKSNCTASVIRRDQYNLAAFPTKYDQASFFVIKSYSEDDVHKSIKYNVWSSTPNGNKKLDNSYQEAQKRVAGKGGNWPVFLFFSVNASGQFCGVAEMIGPVDYERSMDFWQQDKWTGYFPVKWHIIKDVPNPQLRYIILENNENKPVTNSRDTQEVRLPQGLEMLNIFKNYISKTSILDDFDFYESREKVMLQKRIRSRMNQLDRIKRTDNSAVVLPSMGLSAAKSIQPENGNKAKE